MNESEFLRLPPVLELIEADTKAVGFGMGSERTAGALLRTLAASKPSAHILELGTGTGISTAWLLNGMDADSTLTSVDTDAACVAIARRHLGQDPRVEFHVMDGTAFLASLRGKQFDLIFADTWPGKFRDLDAALALLKPGGLYVIDDLLPQPNWPEGHGAKVKALMQDLAHRTELTSCPMAWSSGLWIAVKSG
ncbi:MAG: class I SAM-dependent methyltransferase [Acidobacteria bacterium]|nr:class I SAM-dependent methyltransferase [Acidobacteriota bacterium]